MPKSYKVLERSFINGQLHEAGATVVLEIDSPGSNLKALGEAPDAPLPEPAKGEQGEFTPVHKGAGKWVVVDADEKEVEGFSGNKDEAKAEAERLNSASDNLPDA